MPSSSSTVRSPQTRSRTLRRYDRSSDLLRPATPPSHAPLVRSTAPRVCHAAALALIKQFTAKVLLANARLEHPAPGAATMRYVHDRSLMHVGLMQNTRRIPSPRIRSGGSRCPRPRAGTNDGQLGMILVVKGGRPGDDGQ